MGINAARLTAKGFGDSKPVGANDSPEGKADNRRVEFVKITD
jgi:OOP family OmpA-OmpF porin